MKLKQYLEKIDQMDPCDIEAFVKMSYEVIANKHNLRFDSRDTLTALLAEKVKEAGQLIRAQACHPSSLGAVPARGDD